VAVEVAFTEAVAQAEQVAQAEAVLAALATVVLMAVMEQLQLAAAVEVGGKILLAAMEDQELSS
jgi:hypothetical protein